MAVATERPPVVRVSRLSKRFRLFHERHQSLKQSLLNMRRANYEDFWALKDITFDVTEGETFGIVGHNGSGKSTLLKCLTGILEPDKGSVSVNGSISALLELGAGFHPELSGRENVFLNAAILGVSRRHIEERFDEIVAFSGLEQFIDTPVKNYSSGMFVRLGFAVAINVDPDVLIIDEVLAVGDAEFQSKCSDKISEFRERGKTIVLVTHAMPDVIRLCSRAAWIDHGQLRALGSPFEITEAYLQSTHDGRSIHYHDAMRWGSGEITIEAVRILDAEDRPVEFVTSNESYTLEITLQAARPVIAPVLQLSIFDPQSLLVTEVSTATRNAHLDQVHGTRIVRLEIDEFPLNEGSYEMSCVVSDESGRHEYDSRSRFVRFDVVPGKHRDGGVLSLGGSWNLS